MPKITVKNVEELSTGKLLKQLIDEGGFKTQKDFTNKFNDWLSTSKHFDQPPIAEKDLSRWINGTVKPRTAKLILFADFFNVDVEYLKCTQSRRFHSKQLPDFSKFQDTNDELIQSIKEQQQFEKFKQYCETLGYKFEFLATNSEKVTYETEILENGKLYTLEITDEIGTSPELVIVYPDGIEITPTHEQIKQFMENVNHVLEYEFSKLRKF